MLHYDKAVIVVGGWGIIPQRYGIGVGSAANILHEAPVFTASTAGDIAAGDLHIAAVQFSVVPCTFQQTIGVGCRVVVIENIDFIVCKGGAAEVAYFWCLVVWRGSGIEFEVSS